MASRRPGKSGVKTAGSTSSLPWKLPGWSAGEVDGTARVEVKFVDMCRNADDEDSSLDGN